MIPRHIRRDLHGGRFARSNTNLKKLITKWVYQQQQKYNLLCDDFLLGQV